MATNRFKTTLLASVFTLSPLLAMAGFTPTAYYTVDGTDMETTDIISRS